MLHPVMCTIQQKRISERMKRKAIKAVERMISSDDPALMIWTPLINQFAVWGFTKEGGKFWHDIHNAKIDPVVIHTIKRKLIDDKDKRKAIRAARRIADKREAHSTNSFRISNFCCWDETEEGFDFWSDINDAPDRSKGV